MWNIKHQQAFSLSNNTSWRKYNCIHFFWSMLKTPMSFYSFSHCKTTRFQLKQLMQPLMLKVFLFFTAFAALSSYNCHLLRTWINLLLLCSKSVSNVAETWLYFEVFASHSTLGGGQITSLKLHFIHLLFHFVYFWHYLLTWFAIISVVFISTDITATITSGSN